MQDNDRGSLWIWLAPALLALVLGAMSLPSAGFFADDWVQIAVIEGGGASRFDLFRFFDGDPQTMQRSIDAGVAPWFSHPELKIALWRPLSSALAHLDYALFGATALGPSVHSVGWYVALCAVVGLFFRRLLDPRLALLSALLFAVSASHVQAVVWIAGRGVVVCATLGLLGVLAHMRWRRDGRWWSLLGAALLLSAALLGGEAAIGVIIYLIVWEITRAERSLKSRLYGLIPVAVIVCVWLSAYVLQGYGTNGSGAYISPVSQPLAYLTHLPGRLTYSLGVLFAGLPADLWVMRVGERAGLALLGAALGLPVMAWIGSMLAHMEPDRRRPLLWLGAASLLCLLPQLAGLLGSRSFVLPSLGGSALLAALFLDVLPADGGLLWLRRVGAGLLLTAHVGVGVVLWVTMGMLHDRMTASTDAHLRQIEQPGRHVLLLTSPDPWLAVYGPAQIKVQGRPAPASWHVLSFAECDHVMTRTGTSSFELRTVGCDYLHSAFAEVYRAPGTTRVDETVSMGDTHARVVEVVDANAVNVSFTVPRSLDAPQMVLLAWHDGALVPVDVPEVGGSVELRWLRSW